MPDLKSELSKVINSWETNVPTTTPQIGRKITTNSTRITFNYVRDNPGVTRVAATIALAKLGVKPSSSTSLISVMVARGNLRVMPDGSLFSVQTEYAPINPLKKPKSVKTLTPVPPPEPVEPVEWTVESVIGNLNIRQARAVYDELRKIFGG